MIFTGFVRMIYIVDMKTYYKIAPEGARELTPIASEKGLSLTPMVSVEESIFNPPPLPSSGLSSHVLMVKC